MTLTKTLKTFLSKRSLSRRSKKVSPMQTIYSPLFTIQSNKSYKKYNTKKSSKKSRRKQTKKYNKKRGREIRRNMQRLSPSEQLARLNRSQAGLIFNKK